MKRHAVSTRRQVRGWLGALVALIMTVALLPGAVQADPDDIQISDNMRHVDNTPKRSPLTSTNSDIAFWGDYAFQGNYNGFTIWDISTPRNPQIVSQVLCPGGQGDISVTNDGSLLFFSVDYARTSDSCSSEATNSGDPDGWEGMRVFDISNLRNPDYVGAVATECGSHTHTYVPDPEGENAYLYVSSYGPNDAFPNCQPPHDSISIVEVPLDDPGSASVVAEPVLFPGGGAPGTSGCHDITVAPERELAAGACMGNGILMDISDPVDPQVIDRVRDRNFAFWHSATFNNHGTKVVFTDELGGGGAATCNEEVGPNRGANAIFDIAGAGSSRDLMFRSYYKIPRHQTDNENCVAHNGSLVPVTGGDVMVQAWYQGGVSVYDFTNSSEPEEIGYFDRGALSDEFLTLGGSWSAYYYNGYIYSSDIQQGLDVLRINGTQGDRRVTFDVLNAQTQYQYAEGRSRNGMPRMTAQGDTEAAPVIVPGSPGEKSRTLEAGQADRMMAQSDSMETAEANDADEMFMHMMAPHHHQAVLMSRMAPSRASDPQVKALADRILVEQGLEIDAMQGWQARNGLPVTNEKKAYREMLKDPEMVEMMGMATKQEMRALRNSDGADFDALFLDLMIPHHEGAIDMAVDVSVNGTDSFVRQFASDLMVTQEAQIYEMEQLRQAV
ncbi:putative secreted protein [Serinicoccus hydrothermalis]|uniref:Putative secreted protein n=1 Tax=Serinicoccus hydrothermalis TaxID=1758689 RepID=A0A1B1N9M5_9MICO|nr:DUF305 domain-containing protein [Serinicoccus hydrothermalis]ANS78126.1 putative secreted protein [Serinicoccus hydrothermalis]